MQLRALSIAAAMVMASVGGVRAELLIGAQAGAGPLRFDDLEDFWDDFDLHHDTDPLAFYWEIAGMWRFAERHAARLSVERITTSVTVSLSDPFGTLRSEQNFTAIPISLSYELALTRSASGAATSLGVGASVYWSEFEGNTEFYAADPSFDSIDHSSRKGEGYGFHGYVKQVAPITDRLFLSGMIRGRWADAMSFEDEDGSVPVNLSGLDVSLGVEFEI